MLRDERHQVRIGQEGHRGGVIFLAHAGHRRGLRLGGAADVGVLEVFELEQDAAEVALEDVFALVGFGGGFAQEALALFGAEEVSRVQVEALAAGEADLHAEGFKAEVLGKAPDAPEAVGEGEGDVITFDLGREVGGFNRRGRRERRDGRRWSG